MIETMHNKIINSTGIKPGLVLAMLFAPAGYLNRYA